MNSFWKKIIIPVSAAIAGHMICIQAENFLNISFDPRIQNIGKHVQAEVQQAQFHIEEARTTVEKDRDFEESIKDLEMAIHLYKDAEKELNAIFPDPNPINKRYFNKLKIDIHQTEELLENYKYDEEIISWIQADLSVVDSLWILGDKAFEVKNYKLAKTYYEEARTTLSEIEVFINMFKDSELKSEGLGEYNEDLTELDTLIAQCSSK